jgi:hypothetical protein
LTPYQQIISYYDTLITEYHWTTAEIDDTPIEMLLDLMIVRSIQDDAEESGGEATIDTFF